MIHRRATLAGAPATVPPAAQCTGAGAVTLQEVVLRADHVVCRRVTWSAPSPRRPDDAPVPPGDHGQVGPGVRALVLALGADRHVRQPQLAAVLRDLGSDLAAGPVSHRLVQDQCHR